MASLYRRARSPYWWIKYRRGDGTVVRESTGFEVGKGPDTRKAQELRAQRTLDESRLSGASVGEAWGAWVPGFLAAVCKTQATLNRYKSAWRTLRMFLDEKHVDFPRQVSRALCMEYFDWRNKPDKRIGKYNAKHNTARYEIAVLSLMLREAVRRGFATSNPAKDLGVKRHRPAEKPEFTDEHLAFILGKIEQEPEPGRTFLMNSFLISRYQGCRMNETHLNPITDVDIKGRGGLIRFRIKGGREHVAPLHPSLLALFKGLRIRGATETYAKPANPSRVWFNFMKRSGIKKILPGACFHSLRVTAVTRLARSPNVSESRAMKFIGHASTTIHRTYQRLRTDDLSDCLDALK